MRDVYEKNPQMGDPSSLQPKLAETMSNMDRLRMEIHKNEAWLSEVEGKVAARTDRRHSSDINHLVTQGRERSLFYLCFYIYARISISL